MQDLHKSPLRQLAQLQALLRGDLESFAEVGVEVRGERRLRFAYPGQLHDQIDDVVGERGEGLADPHQSWQDRLEEFYPLSTGDACKQRLKLL